MKRQRHSHLKIYHSKTPGYPSGADRRCIATKALDLLTSAVSLIGFVTAFVFIFTWA